MKYLFFNPKSHLKHLVRFFSALLILISSANPAFADFDKSANWFNSHDLNWRVALQEQLLIAGFYQAFVDGKFGPSTYEAITKFESSRLVFSDGVLNSQDEQKLRDVAKRLYGQLGFEIVHDQRANLDAYIPQSVFAERTELARGTMYQDESGDVILNTFFVPRVDMQFRDVFLYFDQSDERGSVNYSNFSDFRFVVSRENRERISYTLVYNRSGDSVGFSVDWAKSSVNSGELIALWMASNSSPISEDVGLQQDEEIFVSPIDTLPLESSPPIIQDEPQAPSEIKSYGQFVYEPSVPYLLILDGEIFGNTSLDLRRAKAENPEISILALDSPGGSVVGGLLVAHEVADLELNTMVIEGHNCASACSFIFFAGAERVADGKLGVHQISSDNPDLVSAQFALSDIFLALLDFGVDQRVIDVMLRTPPNDMHYFSNTELEQFGINTYFSD